MRKTATIVALSTVTALVLSLSACGDDGGSDESGNDSATSSESSSPSPSGSPSTPEEALAQAYAQYVLETPPANTPEVTGELGSAPTIAKPTGEAPTKMVVKDIEVGDGAEVPVNGTATFNYTGITWDTGEEFDSSWGKEPITFPLGNLIPGWQIGIPGMKEGGRRLLVIPPDLAYGPAGGESPLGGKTLLFVIDVVKVES